MKSNQFVPYYGVESYDISNYTIRGRRLAQVNKVSMRSVGLSWGLYESIRREIGQKSGPMISYMLDRCIVKFKG